MLFFHTYYSIDDQIVPYNRKNSSRQTIRIKTTRFVLSPDDGCPYFLNPYCRAKYGGGKLSRTYVLVPSLILLQKSLTGQTKKYTLTTGFL